MDESVRDAVKQLQDLLERLKQRREPAEDIWTEFHAWLGRADAEIDSPEDPSGALATEVKKVFEELAVEFEAQGFAE